MVLKYFVFLLLVVFLSIFAIINDDIDFSKFDFRYTSYATMKFNDVESLHINHNGIDRKVKASSVIRYNDVDYIKDIKVYLKKENSIETLESNEATNYKKINKSRENGSIEKQVFFNYNAIYKKDDNFSLKSDTLIYDIQNRIIKARSNFIFNQDDNLILGNSFDYNLTDKTIVAKEINSTILFNE